MLRTIGASFRTFSRMVKIAPGFFQIFESWTQVLDLLRFSRLFKAPKDSSGLDPDYPKLDWNFSKTFRIFFFEIPRGFQDIF